MYTPQARNKRHTARTLSAFIAGTTSLAQALLIFVAGRFEEKFTGSGMQLPWLTRAFLPGAPTYYVIAGVALVTYAARHYDWYPTRWPLIGLGLVGILEGPVFVIAMYLPIFQLGTVVSQG